ncbi:ABC transporter permease [bacterium]|nr:ABC transporter permease [bacterium]
MKPDELTRIALGNLWRTKLRTFLTTLGVIIGIGALVSMVSFGIGMQKNVTAAFYENDLFTSMLVSPQQIDVNKAISGDMEGMVNALYEPPPPLVDSTLSCFQTFSGVVISFPEIRFPVKIRFAGNETRINIRAMPASMGQYKPFNDLLAGSFFKSDSQNTIILSQNILKDLNVKLKNRHIHHLTLEDSLKSTVLIEADSMIGDSLDVITSVVDVTKMTGFPGFSIKGHRRMLFKEIINPFQIGGIQKAGSGFEAPSMISGAIIPIQTAEMLPRVGFNNIWDVLGGKHDHEGYGSAIVRVKHIDHVKAVQDSIESMGYSVFSIMDQLSEMKKGFLIFDMGLGAIGTIALIVAALGIINTMVMSILERTREIGIMKAIGGSEGEIRTIFFVEAGMIGLIGGIFGLLLGWLVTKIANAVANMIFLKEMDFSVNFFHIPFWLILSAIAFSIGISLLAGIYPAARAAAVNPVEALRHD